MLDYLEFLLFKFFKFIVLVTPKFIMKHILNGLASLTYVLNKEHKRYAKANLDLVYEDRLDEEEKWNIVKSSYKNLFYNLYEFIENPTLNLEELEKKVTVENEQVILDALKTKRPIILITAHYGNWEYLTSYVSLKYKEITVVGRPLNNDYLNKDLVKARNAHQAIMLSKDGSASGLLRALKKGRMVGLVVDQHNSDGVDVTLLSQKVKMVESATRLAAKIDALIIPAYVEMNGFRSYTIKFNEPIETTQQQADSITEQIIEKPEDWFWQHKRFKIYHGEIYA